jgi:succinyl-CoA synthetase beta subunit
MFHARNIARATDYQSKFVVKAQVQTSNRSKAFFKENGFQGGIHICESPEEVRDVAEMMCGKTLVAPSQKNDLYYSTGDQGFRTRCVYVMEKLEISKKFYVQLSLDQQESCPVIKYANLGSGIPFSKILLHHPHLIKTVKIDYLNNVSMEQLMDVAVDLGIEQQKSQLTFILKHLYDFFIESDCETLELNPLVMTRDQQIYVNSAKAKFDPNSMYRQQQLVMLRDISQMQVIERQAQQKQIRYVYMGDHSIGVMSNSAGLAMATLDVLDQLGAKAANFMDLGGQIYHEKIMHALILMESDRHIGAILINIYCGQASALSFAYVIEAAYKGSYVTKPVIIKVKGRGTDEAIEILNRVK